MEISVTGFPADKSLLYVSTALPACGDIDDARLHEFSRPPSVFPAAPEQDE